MRVYKKDGIKYLFSSKYEIFNEPYGISATCKKDIDTKILNTLNFYKNSYIDEPLSNQRRTNGKPECI